MCRTSSQPTSAVWNRRFFAYLQIVLLLVGGSIPSAAQSQSNERVASADLSLASYPIKTALPKAPGQVELVPPPPMRYVPGLVEPLVATGPVSEQESEDLGRALKAFHEAPAIVGHGGDFAEYSKPLFAFMDAHPQSNWNATLYADIGFGYYGSGYYSRAFTYLEKAWRLGRNADTTQAHLVIDHAVGELAKMHARVGEADQLEALFADIGKRPIGGPATELLQGAREGLWTFNHRPEIAYLCGPNALKNLLITLKAAPEQIQIVDNARSGTHGFSLTQLARLADQVGLKYELVHRQAGQPIPVPSIINWNVHHYAAIVSQHDGLYQLLDPTFGDGAMVVTAKAVDAESSGYFLVPAEVTAVMPEGAFRRISAVSPEAGSVYGMGTVSNSVPAMPNDICILCKLYSYLFSQDDKPPQMTISNAQAMVVGLNLKDTPVGYVPQKGIPATTTISYMQRDEAQPALFSFSNVSPKWTHSWQVYVQDDPNNPGNRVIRPASGGGGYDYSIVGGYPYGYNPTTGAFPPETPENSQLFRVPATGPATSYVRQMPDGSKEVYALSNGATTWPRLMFMTSVSDAAGNTTTLHYDAQFRITSVTDALGRNTTFSYGLPSAPLLITRITDPFGRSTQLTYDLAWRLKSITDPIGITSSYNYSELEPSFVTSLTTPYGTSKFSDTPNPNDHPHSYPDTRSLTLTDPLGYTDYLYFYQSGSSSPSSERVVPSGMSNDNGILQWRNTYYWNKHAFTGNVTLNSDGVVISEDFTKSEIKHWLHYCCNLTYASRELGSVKKPLENRVWNNYPGMATSGYYYYSGYLDLQDATGRVLDDGSTQLSKATYNMLGLPLSKIDPQGRTTTFTYASNNIDLQTVQQLTSSGYTTIATFGNYNSQHEPQLYTGTDGQNWQYNYNAAGQLATVTDPNSGVTTYNYDAASRLSTVVNANQQTVLTLTYDAADLIRTRTDSEGYTLTYDYDALDRIVKVTYPDTTTDRYDYTFQGGPLQGTPSLDLRKHIDRLGRITIYGYDADRRLVSVTEPISTSPSIVTRTTRYDYYEDGTLKDIVDANGNVTHWEIDLESRPISKTYAYGTATAQTETYVYENTTSRLLSITDALGQTKTFTYGKDDRVTDIAYTNTVNPTPNVSFGWDGYFPRLSGMADGLGTTNYSYTAIGINGALKLASVDGPFSNDTIGLTYDALGRLSGRSILGGNESFTYDAISRLTSHGTPLGSFIYGYLGQTDQTTSRRVTNGTTTVSTGWGYDVNRNDRRLISITNSGITRSYALSYLINPSRALFNPYDITKVTDTATPGHPWGTQFHNYGYDQSDRLLTATATVPGNFSYAYDKLDNATTVETPSGDTHPTYNHLNQLSIWGADTYSYDADGNTLSGDGVRSYKWDAENRLIEIDYAGSSQKSQFAYDGLGHRTVDVETVAEGGGTTTTRFLWCGSGVCQTRDGSDNVLRRDLAEGGYSVATGQKLISMPDQLGSIRDVLDGATGSLLAAYDYSPYGAIARSYSSTQTDYRYAELFYHSASILNLGAYRSLDSVTGRFINRDPMREDGGINLYAYVGANTINSLDPWGLLGIDDQMPSSMSDSTPCPEDENEITSSCPLNDAHWKRAWSFDESHYHDNMHLYKEPKPPGQWGSECAYRNGHLVLVGPKVGTANFYPDGTWQHFFVDPGGPRWDPWYDNYWAIHPHPSGIK